MPYRSAYSESAISRAPCVRSSASAARYRSGRYSRTNLSHACSSPSAHSRASSRSAEWAPTCQPAGSVTPSVSLLPDAFPPCRVRGNRRFGTHFLPDVRRRPPGEPRQLFGLAGVPLAKRPTVVGRGGARVAAGPGMPQHVASLEVRAIRGFLEHEVLREVRVVVADVQARDEHVRRPAVAAVGPEDAETPHLVVRQRIGRTRV